MSAFDDAARVIDDLTRRVDQLESEIRTTRAVGDGPPRTAYRPREVSEMTGIGYDAVLALIESGELDAVQVGRLHVVSAASVKRLMSRIGEVIELDSRRSA